jgi:peptidoglycan/xylan/chitin deacetylase (PgdA/CDA1 family)
VRPLILNYHAFGERSTADDPNHHFVPVESFAAQIDLLLGRGWRSLDEASYLAGLAGTGWPTRSFLITIDDGFESTLEGAKVLAARGVAAIVYIPAGLIGDSTSAWSSEMRAESLLDADGTRALLEHGLSIGAHGWDHRPMDGMTATELERNTRDARDALADVSGAAPRTFAYPGGHYDDAARAAVESAGYDAAFAVTGSDGRFAIPRIDVNGTDTMRTFAMTCSRWWPAAQSVGKRVPRLRRGLHRLVGSAR